MKQIILTTLNARFIHTSLGLRYILANMESLEADTSLLEFTLESQPVDIVESLLQERPKIVGFGVYIWNVEQTTKVVALLKQVAPEVVVVLGGPEVSFEHPEQDIVQWADYVIAGYGDVSFGKLCKSLLADEPPSEKIIQGEQAPLPLLNLPYSYYTDEDIAHRVIYVEASRGCPYKCEFCLSALDKTMWPFDLDRFLAEMQSLFDRGVRQFKFVDRTFNLKPESSIRILEFFLARMDEHTFLHFELVPDRLPEKLKELILRFPEGSLQFEIGIQSFNPEVQRLISRTQDDKKTEENLAWLRKESQAHLHTDLIVGLPGEDLESFAKGFDKLVALDPHEIQVGILKRLRGTPIIRHTEAFTLKFNPHPPYNILSTDRIDFETMQRLNRFARYWDMIANSGRFGHTKAVILGDRPFHRFMALSDGLYDFTKQTHRIALDRLFELVYTALVELLKVDEKTAAQSLSRDYLAGGGKALLSFVDPDVLREQVRVRKSVGTPSRQTRHLAVPN